MSDKTKTLSQQLRELIAIAKTKTNAMEAMDTTQGTSQNRRNSVSSLNQLSYHRK